MEILKKVVVATWLITTVAALMPHNEIQEINVETNTINYRLPDDVKPISYDLEITVDLLENLTFEGKVRIEVEVLDETNQIILHSYRLSINSIKLFEETTEVTDVTHNFATDDTHFLTITRSNPLKINTTYFIEIEFNADLADDMYGFYKSSYYTTDNELRWIAATKLQTAYARRVMPCFDEPGFKATFQVTIINPPGYHSRSNMPLEGCSPEEREDDWKIYRFKPTLPMSTYLMAFVISDFESLIDLNDKYDFSAWARPEAIKYAEYSQSIGPEMVDYLENYTGIVYSFPKIDQVALPDYVSGATENWGLIAYRETGLLYYEEASTESNKKSTAMVVAHELAHLWFGNLVTCKWWSDTWLNEAFANYFQYVVTDKVHPDWRMIDQFVLDQQQGIFGTDSLASTPALSSDCNTPAECQARFTAISYNKGAAILNMVSHILTPETFQAALRNYLIKHQYSSTVPEDLFDALEEQRVQDQTSPHTVYDFMTRWTTQPGYPVINVARNGSTFTVSQERFLLKTDDSAAQYTWWVPLTWTKESEAPNGFSNTHPEEWLIPVHRTCVIEMEVQPSEWVIFNNQETGYYRVNYDADSWKLIIEGLHNNPEKFHILNRAQLVDDALNLARADKLDYATALDVLDYLHKEDDYIPWGAAATALTFLSRKLASEDDYHYFQTYIKDLIADKYEKLGFDVPENEEHLNHLHRASLLNWACTFNRPDCVEEAQKKFADYMNNNNLVHANLRSVVYCTALRKAGEDEWNFLWNIYKESRIATEQVSILSALGCTEDDDLIQNYLKISIDPDTVIRKQDTMNVFTAVYSTARGVDAALDFLINNFQAISENYRRQNALSTILSGIGSRLTTEQQVQKLEEFVTANTGNLGSAEGAARSAIESARADMEWTNLHKGEILGWFKNKVDPPTESPIETSTDSATTEPSTQLSTQPSTQPSIQPSTERTTTDSASMLSQNGIICFIIVLICSSFMEMLIN